MAVKKSKKAIKSKQLKKYINKDGNFLLILLAGFIIVFAFYYFLLIY